jgi:hypothetical protein
MNNRRIFRTILRRLRQAGRTGERTRVCVGKRHMRAVLEIDAAWTLTQPSSVALAVERGWHLIAAVVASYQRFQALADSRPGRGLTLQNQRQTVGSNVRKVSISVLNTYMYAAASLLPRFSALNSTKVSWTPNHHTVRL